MSAARESTVNERPLRIGEVAARLGTTPRTIRYYEEIGLLPGAPRPIGGHRSYSETEVERLAEILRLKALLGLSLDAVQGMLEAEDARRLLRERFHRAEHPQEQREIVIDALGHVDRQLSLARERRAELGRFEQELAAKRHKLRRRLTSLEQQT